MDQRNVKAAAFQAHLDQFCRLWPESNFYFSRLQSYTKSPKDEPTGIRVVEIDPQGDAAPTFTEIPPDSTGGSSPARHLPSLAVVEGHLSPSAVVELASQYHLRPEFFLGHLELERVQNRFRTSYELPPLPSRRGEIVHVRLPSVWRSTSSGSVYPENLHAADRARADAASLDYEQHLFKGPKAGATRFRKVHLQNSKHFIIEQVVSFSIARRVLNGQSAWTCVYLLDSGLPLGCTRYPWNLPRDSVFLPPTLLHTVHYNEQYVPTQTDVAVGSDLPDKTFKMHPYNPLKVFASNDRCRLLAENPFFGLASLLTAAAASWNQTLNFIEDDIAVYQDIGAEKAADALEQMRYNLGLVQRFESFIQSDLDTLRYGLWKSAIVIDTEPGTEWKDSEDGNVDEERKSTYEELQQDIESLLRRCKLLSQRCESASGLLQSSIALLEAQKSMEQTSEVNKLSKLAFVFVPVSLVSSVFGMNVVEINPTSTANLWQFVLLTIVVLIPSLIVSFRGEIKGRFMR